MTPRRRQRVGARWLARVGLWRRSVVVIPFLVFLATGKPLSCTWIREGAVACPLPRVAKTLEEGALRTGSSVLSTRIAFISRRCRPRHPNSQTRCLQPRKKHALPAQAFHGLPQAARLPAPELRGRADIAGITSSPQPTARLAAPNPRSARRRRLASARRDRRRPRPRRRRRARAAARVAARRVVAPRRREPGREQQLLDFVGSALAPPARGGEGAPAARSPSPPRSATTARRARPRRGARRSRRGAR